MITRALDIAAAFFAAAVLLATVIVAFSP